MKKFLIVVCVLVIVLTPILTAFAMFYDNDYFNFQYETGLTGGKYVYCDSNLGSVYVVFPSDRCQYISLINDWEPINISSSTINVKIYLGSGSVYDGRLTPFGTTEYRLNNNVGYTYYDLIITDIFDSNIEFITESDQYNSSLYLDKFQIIIVSLLLFILLFEILGWFLLHKI